MKFGNKIVIARLYGGVGNQLFIYAMAKNIAKRNNADLILDVKSGFKNDKFKRTFLLDYFNIDFQIADDYSSFISFFGKFRRKFVKCFNRILPLTFKFYLQEYKNAFNEAYAKIDFSKTLYIDGYWQSFKYFRDVCSDLRLDLVFVHEKSHLSLSEAEFIRKQSNSVAVHIRSYKEVPESDNATSLGFDYYINSINYLKKKIKNPYFFIFTDSLEKLNVNLFKDLNFKIIDIKIENIVQRDIEELWLMSLCNNQIIANSTFSWWGAWINNNPEKIIIAPAIHWNNYDIIPNDWILI